MILSQFNRLTSQLSRTMDWSRIRQSDHYQNAYDRLFAKHKLQLANQTPKQTIYDNGLAKVYAYTPHHRLKHSPIRFAIPVLLVSPLAIKTSIYDLFPKRSLVDYLTKQGFKVYLVDWGAPTRQQTHLSFDYYVKQTLPEMVKVVQAHSNSQKYSLHGWSLAGIFVTVYAAAMQDPNLANLIVQGSPINSHKDYRVGRIFWLSAMIVNQLERHTSWSTDKIPKSLFHSYGWMNATGFKLMDPVGTLQSHLQLLRHLGDRAAVESHATIGDFLNRMVAYPGGIARDTVFKVWIEGDLADGHSDLVKPAIELRDIIANLLVVAGRKDSLVTSNVAQPLVDLVGSTDTTFITAPGGHVGMLSSHSSAREFWPQLVAWLGTRSQPYDPKNADVLDLHLLDDHDDDQMLST